MENYFTNVSEYYEFYGTGRSFGNSYLMTVRTENEDEARNILKEVCEQKKDSLMNDLNERAFNFLVSFSEVRTSA